MYSIKGAHELRMFYVPLLQWSKCFFVHFSATGGRGIGVWKREGVITQQKIVLFIQYSRDYIHVNHPQVKPKLKSGCTYVYWLK